MITRKIGKLLRGDATPFQLFSAAILASLIGFMPGFMQAPGLLVVFLALLVVLNANLGLAALVGGLAKLVSLLLMPVTFKVGYFLLDGPTSGFFQSMINAPVLALFGFEHYVTTGGLAMGLIFGLVVGSIVVRLLGRFRRKVVDLEKNSERFQKYASKFWVRFLMFVFVGKRHKAESYEALLSKRIGKPIRPVGVVLVVLLGVLAVLVQLFASKPIVTMIAQRSLEHANGATVDLEEADLNLKENRFTIKGLAMADPNALDTDLLRADLIEADLSGVNLLKKRLQIDRLVLSNASQGEKRSAPGHLVGPPPRPTPKAEKPVDLPDAKTIEDYIQKAKEWKERLAQVKEWLEKISGPEEAPSGEQAPGETRETLRERLEREIREKGYALVKADHLIEGSPTLTISELTAEKVRVAQLEGETVDVTGKNLSTQPRLLGKTPEVRIKSSSGDLNFDVVLGALGETNAQNTLSFSYRGLPTDQVVSDLKFAGGKPVQGGTMDVAFDGTWQNQNGVYVDLPLNVTLHDATLSLPNLSPTQVSELSFPIRVKGPLDNPAIQVEGKALSDSLVQAGISRAKAEATQQLKEKVNEELGGKAGEAIGEQGKKLLDGILGGGKKKDDE